MNDTLSYVLWAAFGAAWGASVLWLFLFLKKRRADSYYIIGEVCNGTHDQELFKPNPGCPYLCKEHGYHIVEHKVRIPPDKSWLKLVPLNKAHKEVKDARTRGDHDPYHSGR